MEINYRNEKTNQFTTSYAVLLTTCGEMKNFVYKTIVSLAQFNII